jgi:uncharacterized protein YecE (DUF72 family)
MQFYVGCSGWSHEGWLGRFYPPRLPNARWLQYYTDVFDYVEIDSTFYKIPRREMTLRWASNTPPDFRFTAKFPQVVTHDTRLGGGLEGLKQFFEVMKPLEQKMLCLIMQLPPSLTRDEGLPKLERLIPLLWKKYRYAIEVRHKSWLDRQVYELLKKHNICLAWSQQDAVRTPPEITADFIYLRFTGDKGSGTMQKDRTKEMEYWARQVKDASGKVDFGVVAADNRYAGFGPATANQFGKMLGLNEVMWEETRRGRLA